MMSFHVGMGRVSHPLRCVMDSVTAVTELMRGRATVMSASVSLYCKLRAHICVLHSLSPPPPSVQWHVSSIVLIICVFQKTLCVMECWIVTMEEMSTTVKMYLVGNLT